MTQPATEIRQTGSDLDTQSIARVTRVAVFVDGFNLYHALQEPRLPPPQDEKYRCYKWLNINNLVMNFIDSPKEEITALYYFTAYPTWNDQKKLRHQTYVSALRTVGAQVVEGEFKPTTQKCRGTCEETFGTFVEKQTDVNISVALIEHAPTYDKAILLTADADQAPAVRLLKRLHPEKVVSVLPPIGRGSKELKEVCHSIYRMTEDMLNRAQFPDTILVQRGSGLVSTIMKPERWPRVPDEGRKGTI
jgi:uncharacterized LabA/DUF88 family protein